MNRFNFVAMMLYMCMLIFPANALAFKYATAKITLEVTDEAGRVIEGAFVTGGFYDRQAQNGGHDFQGYTDRLGCFTVSERTHGELIYGVQKENFYETKNRYREWFINQDSEILGGKWQPWNPVIKVVLKKIQNPVAMYAKKVEATIPTLGKPVGFDLEIGDWVTPYGKGTTSDFIFTFQGVFKSLHDRKERLILTFSNMDDGIRELKTDKDNDKSMLALPYHAPQEGYNPEWSLEKILMRGVMRKNIQSREGVNYIFRVRTVKNDNGQVIKANYGKIHGDIKFGFSSADGTSARVDFTYYLNPDGTRNLEFDPKKNLFQNLNSLEQVFNP